MKQLNQLNTAGLSILKVSLDCYQQFETSSPQAAKHFKEIVEYLIGPVDGINVWSIREQIRYEDDKRSNSKTLTIASADTFAMIDQLRPQERKVLMLLGEGHQNEAIGSLLSISPRTVANHKMNIANKLGLGSAKVLVQFALKNLEFL